MAPSDAGMFEPDREYSARPTAELEGAAATPTVSVVTRARSILELGRRAVTHRELTEDLLSWASDPAFHRVRWVGAVTLAWIAAAAVGYSAADQHTRERLWQALDGWQPDEREDLLSWASHEPWFRDRPGMSG
jgi:hypothetical protein